MFATLRLRSEINLEETCDAFLDHSSGPLLRHLLFPSEFEGLDDIMVERALTTPDLQNYHSSASAPSLRSREPVDVMDRPRSSDGDANVKVVVRVRKFIKRGKHLVHLQSRINKS